MTAPPIGGQQLGPGRALVTWEGRKGLEMHIGVLNGGDREKQTSPMACLVDLCKYVNRSVGCLAYDGCSYDYKGCCNWSDTCGTDWVG
jgi:hypothetical protein